MIGLLFSLFLLASGTEVPRVPITFVCHSAVTVMYTGINVTRFFKSFFGRLNLTLLVIPLNSSIFHFRMNFTIRLLPTFHSNPFRTQCKMKTNIIFVTQSLTSYYKVNKPKKILFLYFIKRILHFSWVFSRSNVLRSEK